MMFKDACNAKSNQRHLGTIRGSNLCTEIVEYTSEDEVAVCNLASIALPRFVLPAVEGGAAARFDLQALHDVSRVVAKSLDRVIDRSEYPLVEARNSNLRHRPVGIGVQGLADAFALLGLPFEGADAAALNRDIFEAIYHGALTASCELAEQLGAHPSHPGSPASQGELQFDMWGVTPSTRWDWAALKARILTLTLTLTLSLSLSLTPTSPSPSPSPNPNPNPNPTPNPNP